MKYDLNFEIVTWFKTGTKINDIRVLIITYTPMPRMQPSAGKRSGGRRSADLLPVLLQHLITYLLQPTKHYTLRCHQWHTPPLLAEVLSKVEKPNARKTLNAEKNKRDKRHPANIQTQALEKEYKKLGYTD
jgi:hypothetical protein